MHKTITIDGKEMEFTANAATPYRFKQVFKSDLLQILGDEQRAEKEGVEAVTELAYIMNMQARKENMANLDYEGFLTWLEGFGSMAFINSAEDILGVYTDQIVGTSTP